MLHFSGSMFPSYFHVAADTRLAVVTVLLHHIILYIIIHRETPIQPTTTILSPLLQVVMETSSLSTAIFGNHSLLVPGFQRPSIHPQRFTSIPLQNDKIFHIISHQTENYVYQKNKSKFNQDVNEIKTIQTILCFFIHLLAPPKNQSAEQDIFHVLTPLPSSFHT